MRLSDRGCEALRLHLLAPAGIWWRVLAHGHGLPGALSDLVGFSPKSEHIVSRGCRRSGGYLVRVARGIRGVRAKFNTDEKWGGGGARGSGVALRRLGPAEADVIRRPLPRHLISEAGLSELRLQVRPATGKGVPPWVGDPM